MGVTFLTGASSGIGRSLARRMALAGDVVVAVARHQPLLDSLINEVAQAGGRALAISCDVTDRESVFAAVRQTEASVGPIDRLIANAGGGEPTFVETFTAAHIDRVYALNVGGTANCIEAILPSMLARRAGHIVAVSSLAAYRGVPSGAAYSAAKAALTNMLESLRIDLRPWGVDVTILFPGFVRTRESQKRRPFPMDVEDATWRMYRAIIARKRRYAFPFPLVLLTTLGQLLPAALYDHLLAGRGRKPKPRK
ncbi:MAG TPA: SDR family NAD(P)-dependent oxidoreductase [Candidatus Binatia bacterium]|nr:SDR family NAD(P)-dependent oxidoreductase [Candidatus Binatia bacterium]